MIVGAGLAGCSIAWRLQEAGQPFRLIGSSQLPSAVEAAAGIINPVTGRWMTKSWRFDTLATEAARFYRSIEKRFSVNVFHPIPATRFCLNAEDAKRAGRRSRNPRYAGVLGDFAEPSGHLGPFRNAHGCLHIHGAAYVDLPQVVDILRHYFSSLGRFEDAVFDYEGLKPHGSGWTYGGEHFDRVIFCEGAALRANPWFGDLPLTPAKGETLLCRSETFPAPDGLVHHGKWLLPYPDGSFRIGATYDEQDLRPEPTGEARVELREAFAQMTASPQALEVLQQPVGIRPSTRDAKPLLGRHPEVPGLFVFNGLGAKGASLAPTLSREMHAFLFHAGALHPETDIQRLFPCA